MKIVEVNSSETLKELIDKLIEDPNLQLKNPSLTTEDKSLYFSSGVLEKPTRPNLEKKLSELIEDEDTINITDPTQPTPVYVEVRFKTN